MQNEEEKPSESETQRKPLRQSPNELCKERVRKIKHLLPKNFRDIIYAKYPQYDTAEGMMLINNCVYIASSDVFLTEILEAIAAEQVAPLEGVKKETANGEDERKVA